MGSELPCGGAANLSCGPRRRVDLFGPKLPVELTSRCVTTIPKAAFQAVPQQSTRHTITRAGRILNRTAEMKVEIEKTIAQLNTAAKFLLEAIEGLSAKEVGLENKGS